MVANMRKIGLIRGILFHRLFLVALIGAICLYFAELIHRWAGIWQLTDRISTTWWIIVVYFFVLNFLGIIFYQINRYISFPVKLSSKHVIIEIVIMSLTFSVPSMFPSNELLAAIPLFVYILIRLINYRIRGDIVVFFTAIIVDYVVEGLLIANSFYTYQCAQYTPLPLWSPFLFGGIGISLRRVLRFTTQKDC